jgi:PAS domain S-box-containing protein
MAQQNRTVLIVDNFSPDRETYHRYLLTDSDYAYNVLEAESGKEGLALCQRDKIDAILLDFWLPDIDGLEFIKQLKTKTGSHFPPVIMITGHGNEATIVKAIKSGAEDFLVKGKATETEIRLSIANAIENAELQRKLQASEERFRISVENMLDCFGVFSAIRDLSGRIVDFQIDYLNAAALESNRMTKADIGKYLCKILPSHRLNGLFVEYCRVVETGEPLVKEDLIYTDTFGGEYLTRAYEVRVNKLEDGFVASWRDITARKQAEIALVESERRFRAIFDSTFQFIGLLSPDGILLEANQTAIDFGGFARADVVNRPFWEARWWTINPETQAELQQAIVRAVDGEFVRYEVDVLGAGDRIITIDFSLKPVWDETGKVVLLIPEGRDITNKKKAEEQLRQSQHFIQRIAEAIPGLLYVYDLIEKRNVYINCHATEQLGYSPEQIQAMGASVAPSLIHPDDLAEFSAHLERFNSASNTDILEFEYRIKDTNGEWSWFCSREIIFQRNQLDLPQQILGISQDITERKQAEATLRGLFDSDLIGIVFWNIQGQITNANTTFQQMTGYTREEIQAGNIYYQDITPPEYHELDAEKFQALVRGESRTPTQKEYICKDGRRIPILLGCSFLPGYSDRGVAFVLDISEQKLLQQEREELLVQAQAARFEAETANRSKDEFIAVISHELRSPLNSILGWTKLLQTRKFDAAATNHALEIIERNAKTQSQLIEDLLDISRIVRGNLRLNLTSVNLVSMITEALDMLNPAAQAKQINIQSQLDETIRQVSGDFNRLQQILTNLLTNAIKFTPNRGQVRIELYSEPTDVMDHPGTAVIKVTDSGIGINPDFLPYVFEPFRQVGNTTRRTKDGLGLGLAIVRNLVELHGGRITADSQGEGLGATFTVKLPLICSDICSDICFNTQTAPISVTSLAGIKILVIDDDEDSLEFVRFVLNNYEATVKTLSDAVEAVTIVNQFQPDIIISDISMPREDGYSFLKKLRLEETRQARKQIPAIALTALASRENRNQSLSVGFQTHLVKPIKPTELATVIANLVRIQPK